MQAIDKVRDTSASHERVSIIEVMGRNAGYLALWAGIATGAEDILLPEEYNYNEQEIITQIIENRKKGKTHHIIINAEGIGHSQELAKRIEAATGIETRATILGHMQRGGDVYKRQVCRQKACGLPARRGLSTMPTCWRWEVLSWAQPWPRIWRTYSCTRNSMEERLLSGRQCWRTCWRRLKSWKTSFSKKVCSEQKEG